MATKLQQAHLEPVVEPLRSLVALTHPLLGSEAQR